MSLAERSSDFDVAVANSLGAARDHLLSLQQAAGCWKGELETNVCMDAEDLLLRHFLGILDEDVAAASGAWIRSQQRDDGTWCTFYGGPGDLSATVEAYVALRLVGDDPASAHLERAAAWIRAHGGIVRTRVFTRIWMAMVGQWDWEDLPVLPPEIMLLPPQVPVNIYDFGCWARQTIVAISIVMAHRPARPLPFSLVELRVDPYGPPPITLPGKPARTPGQPGRSTPLSAGRLGVAGRPLQAQTPAAFELLDRALHRYEHLPDWVFPRTLARRTALRLAEEWIIRRQEADGCWGGIQPPLVYSVIALHLQGYPLDHPVMKAALTGMEGFVIDDERGRRIEACQSPVWDTALAVVALADAGVGPEDPTMRAATRWLVAEEVTVRGDWTVRRPNLSPGGWAFEFANVNYPDIDDTAEVILALRRAGVRHLGPGDEAVRRGVAWTEGMQSRGGGWGAFDADNDSEVCASLPFSDFGEVTDPPSSDVTAHMLEMLAGEPSADPAVIRRGRDWLLAQQETDGSWFGRWGVNYVYGTGAAVPALVRVGVSVDDPRIRRAVAWLEDHQNPDGGWGEDLRSYIDDAWRGRGTSTASQTAWALLALLAAGERQGAAVERGVAWLLETQTEEGTWDEPWFTGTGFPWDFSLNYHLYRLVFPLSALGRYLESAAGPQRPRSRGVGGVTAGPATGQHLILAPLSVEAWALRLGLAARPEGLVKGRLRAARRFLASNFAHLTPPSGGESRKVPRDPDPDVELVPGPRRRADILVLRAGAGPQRAAATAGRLNQMTGPTRSDSGRVVIIAGVGGALVDDLHPGDLVVADRILRPDGGCVRMLPGAVMLAGALRRAGLAVRVGPVISTEVLVRGSGPRRALAARGALVVDLESAALAGGLPGGTFAVVRAVADTPGRELLSPATVTGGLAALRSLRAAAPVLEAWAASAGRRRVVLAAPRSYCAGVERAIHTVERALERFGAPVYVRRQIVHNRHVVAALEARGAIFVEELAEVPEHATAVYSAHGVGRGVRAEAASRQLRVIDATCPLVAKVHSEVRRFAAAGRQVVLVGHAGHDEIQGTLDQTDGVLLVERAADVAHLVLDDANPVAYATQTTLSPDDVNETVGALRRRWPEIVGPSAADICYATQNRQRAVTAIAGECDLLLVVGSANSSNSHRLVEVAGRLGACAKLIDDVSDLDPTWLVGTSSVGVTAGASAPESLVEELVATLVDLGADRVETSTATTESISFSLPVEVR